MEFGETKGELRLLGRRQMVMNMDSLCDHLDTLVGSQVAEVIITSLELREGKEEAELFRREHPHASVDDVLNFFIEYDSLTGVGITSVKRPEDTRASIVIQISNPYIKKTTGSSKSLLFSWWSGVLSSVLHRDLDFESISYDPIKDVLSCTMVPREIK